MRYLEKGKGNTSGETLFFRAPLSARESRKRKYHIYTRESPVEKGHLPLGEIESENFPNLGVKYSFIKEARAKRGEKLENNLALLGKGGVEERRYSRKRGTL